MESFYDLAKAAIRQLDHGKQWGKWSLDSSTQCLVHADTRYEVGLREMTTCGHMLDWIMQVASKSWCSVEDLGQLVRAIDEIFWVQQHFCYGGSQQQVDAVALLANRLGPPPQQEEQETTSAGDGMEEGIETMEE